jgi:hypothetical protein
MSNMLIFSKLIIDTIKDLESPLWPFVQDYACGGHRRRISLFTERTKSRANRFAQVDMFSPFARKYVGLLLEDDSQKKGALTPRAAFGRGIGPICCNFVIDGKSPAMILPIRRAVLIQCIDLDRVSDKSSKRRQFENVEKNVRGFLGNGCGSIADYFLIAGTYPDFTNGLARERLRDAVKLAIDRYLNESIQEDVA